MWFALYMINSVYTRLTQVFFFLLIDFFFQFYSSTLDWLGISLNDLFWFDFYKVILVSRLGSWVWSVNPVDLSLFYLFLIDVFFFSFTLQYWVDYELGFMVCYDLLFMRLSLFYDSCHVFCELNRVDSGCFIVSYFYIDFFFNFILQQWVY
jgi:hypothetical protein